MTTPIEDLIRAAQQRQAERAHGPDRLLTELPARAARQARRRRYQTLGTVAVAAAVAAALTVPAFGLRNGTSGAPSQPAAQPSSAATPAATSTFPPVALRYRPTWLPPGLTERIRTGQPVSAGNDSPASMLRVWTDRPVGTDGAGVPAQLVMSMRQASGTNDPLANTGVEVDINGTLGYYHASDKPYVEWRADAGTVVALQQHELNLSQHDLLRIARSVQPDPAQLLVPLHVGWLPDGMNVITGQVSGDSPAAWMAMLGAHQQPTSGSSASSQRSITVSLSPTTIAPAGGRSLTVNGHPARLVIRTDRPMDMRYVVVDLGDGRKLTVSGVSRADPLTDDDLIRVAEHAAPSDPVDVAWIATP
ncbi:hypothetical protein AB0H83_05575 [Dactylosporangium sp. NPDC050688]|uniref:hypothetical protein n=1 Tax=Dactylosporangium sp. NPDC050688 TaxID=3157217 RepID=UPI0033E47AA8